MGISKENLYADSKAIYICRFLDPRLHQKQLTCVADYWSIRHQQDSYLLSPVHTVSLMNSGIPIQNFQMVANYPHFLISHLKVRSCCVFMIVYVLGS